MDSILQFVLPKIESELIKDRKETPESKQMFDPISKTVCCLRNDDT